MITRTEWQKFTDTVYKTCFTWTKRVRFDSGTYIHETFDCSDMLMGGLWFTTKTYSKLKNDHMADYIFRFGTDLQHKELETLDRYISIHNNDLLRKRRIQLAADLRTAKLNKKLKERGM